MTKPPRDAVRRGVLLLIVLGMLAMFALVGITFVVLTSHERRGAEAARRVEQYADPADDLLNQAMLQTLRGTENSLSVLRPHSLLEDLYGNDVIAGTITQAVAVSPTVVDCTVTGLKTADFARCLSRTLTLCEGPRDATMVPNNAAGINYAVQNVDPVARVVRIALPPPSRPLVTGERYLSATDLQGYIAGANPISFVVPSPQGVPLMADTAILPGNPQLIEMTIPNGRQHVGKLVTMLDGPAAGLTTRIVSFNGANPDIVHALPFPGGAQAVMGNHCLFNGTPFSGTGFGYNPHVTGVNVQLTQVDPETNLPAALLPNSPINGATLGGANEDYDAADFQNMLLGMQVPRDTTISGIPAPAGTTPIPSLLRPALVNYWFNQLNAGGVPGFAWPAGVTNLTQQLACFATPLRQDTPGVWYWGWDASNIQNAYRLVALKRRLLLRPLPDDHPEFTGSNPNSPFVFGIGVDTTGTNIVPTWNWDVDNDGDGINDSIWVDLGMPARPGKDGRLYKPLFAILCVDMDGRLNLNAHGNYAQAKRYFDTNGDGAPDVDYQNPVPPMPATAIFAGTTAPTAVALTRGQGWGPAEINLLPLLANAGGFTPEQQYQRLLAGYNDGAGHLLDGRYGESNWWTAPIAPMRIPGPGWTRARALAMGLPGANKEDPLADNQVLGYPDAYATGPGSYGSPPDLKGTMAVGLDLLGQPIYSMLPDSVVQLDTGDPTTLMDVDHPYQMNLALDGSHAQGSPAAKDNPFGVGELEHLLRPYDADASNLPSRITMLAPSLSGRQRELTTESWSLPCPSVALPPELRDIANVQTWMSAHKAHQLADVVRAKVLAENAATLNDPNDTSAGGDVETLNSITSRLLPPEMFAGLKMDLNRPFGNGQDDDGNGVVDEPSAAETNPFNQYTYAGVSLATPPPCNLVNNADVDNNGTFGDAADQLLARQLYARQLYVQMLALMNYHVATPGNPTVVEQAIARRVAQWAINMVDFRDRDAIMTPFEYDVEPFHDNSAAPDGNTWDVNGVLGPADAADPHPDDGNTTYRGLVWGCERPELLITETLAFHDRRTENLADDGGTIGGTPPDDHQDFDQRHRPQGSLFVELYNPWTAREPQPAEFYEATYHGVALNATDAGTHTSGVWRLAIVTNPADIATDPDNPAVTPLHYERTAYFCDLTTPGMVFPAADSDVQYHPSAALAGRFAPIKPGRYAVIGPGKPSDITNSRTFIGRCPATAVEENLTRRIVLQPDPNPETAGQVELSSNGTAVDYTGMDMQNPVAMIINEPHRLSVSEPALNYYDAVDSAGNAFDPTTDAYAAAWAGPRDRWVPGQPVGPLPPPPGSERPLWVVLCQNGTHANFAKVHLQRLANPLLPYDAATNPYRTVDSMQVDLTTFNGADHPIPGSGEEMDTPLHAQFFSRERGEPNENTQPAPADPPTPPPPPVAITETNNLWASLPLTTTRPMTAHPIAPGAGHVYDKYFACSLGYLNEGYQHFDPAEAPAKPAWWTLAEVGAATEYVGAPRQPFPWLTWLNRPFTSEMELTLVPMWRSSQLLLPTNFGVAAAGADPYTQPLQPFPQVINFFYDNTPAANPFNQKLHRLLDFVRVPSPFVGTELQGNPANFVGGNHTFHPPFNRISNYREPGRVNINTIASGDVWRGLMNYGAAPTWHNVVESRRGFGYAGAAGDMFAIDPRFPTQFGNPFRSADGLYQVPLLLGAPSMQTLLDNHEVNATLLRRNNGNNDPLFADVAGASHNDPNRNPAFRYQTLKRLGSTVTTQSNVYAVWITVGYFEAKPWLQSGVDGTGTPINWRGQSEAQFLAIHPDRYELGQEFGADTGETQRHRAFYIIDRSIPVGFQRGRDYNVDKAVLLKRFIE